LKNDAYYYYADEEFLRIPSPFEEGVEDIGEALEEMVSTPWREFEDEVGFQIKLFEISEELADELVDEDSDPLEAAYVVVLSLGDASQAIFVRDLVSLYQVLI
jgi:hypothetical protein